MKFRKATLSDCKTLVELSLRLRQERDLTYDEPSMRKITEEFFMRNMSNGFHVAFVCELDNKIVAIQGLALFEIPPTDKLPSGKVAKLINVYTLPEYRKRGIARKMLNFVSNYALDSGYHKIMLTSSPMGKSLYESEGFLLLHNEYERFL